MSSHHESTPRAMNGTGHRLMMTPDDERELRDLGDELKSEFMMEYESYLYTRGRNVDATRWKELRRKNNMCVYRERARSDSNSDSDIALPSFLAAPSSSNGSQSPSSSSESSSSSYWKRQTSSSTMEIGPNRALAANSRMPVLLAVGTAPGTVDEALYGITANDTTSLHRRNMYLGEVYVGSGVLVTMDDGTWEDPYRFMGVTWFHKQLAMFDVVRPREFLNFVSMHVCHTSRGERIGLVLYHPIAHRGLPDSTDSKVLRGKHLLCCAFRQFDEERIEIYVTETVDPMGNVMEFVVRKEVTQLLLDFAVVTDIGLRKTLYSLMREAQARRSAVSSEHSNSASSDSSGNPRYCGACTRRLGKLFSGSSSTCQLCFDVVCSKCRVTKKLVVEDRAGCNMLKALSFCLRCMVKARKTSTLAIAQRELESHRGGEGSRPTNVNGSSSLSTSDSGFV